MKRTWRLFRRGTGWFYAEHALTKKQEALKTQSREEAERLVAARNEAANGATLSLALGRTYLMAADPQMLLRTWADVVAVVNARGSAATRERKVRAYRAKPFIPLLPMSLAETKAEHMLGMLDGKDSTRHFLKLLHSCAVSLGWLPSPLLPKGAWPKAHRQQRRGITWEEHCRILEKEKCPERSRYYRLLWETGAAQHDGANMGHGNISGNYLVYIRQKTGEHCSIGIGPTLRELLSELPRGRWFFPRLQKWSSVRRSAEFNRRCQVAGVSGVSLHSYRYAWAERAYVAGYPERFAQAALGHGSKAVHRAYAKGARVQCPPLEGWKA